VVVVLGKLVTQMAAQQVAMEPTHTCNMQVLQAVVYLDSSLAEDQVQAVLHVGQVATEAEEPMVVLAVLMEMQALQTLAVAAVEEETLTTTEQQPVVTVAQVLSLFDM
jgi:hypothetical protein